MIMCVQQPTYNNNLVIKLHSSLTKERQATLISELYLEILIVMNKNTDNNNNNNNSKNVINNNVI